MLKDKTRREDEKTTLGAYSYSRSDKIYTEEKFTLYRSKKELSLTIISEIYGRVSTGETLNIVTEYTASKNFLPMSVFIERTLGQDFSRESFIYDTNSSHLFYHFSKDHELLEPEDIVKNEETISIPTPPVFHISTPSAAASMLFLKSKKFDSASKNFYNLLASSNSWSMDNKPIIKNIALEKMSLTSEALNISGQNVEAVQYKLTQFRDKKDKAPSQPDQDLRIYVSKFHTIPYMIRSPDGTKIQIKFLNNLDTE